MSKLLNIGYEHFDNGDLITAQKSFVQLIKKEPNNGAGYLALGRVAKAAFQFDQAITLLQKACGLLDRQPEPLLELADTFNAVHSPKDVETVLQFAYQNCPTHKAVHNALVQHYLANGQSTYAIPLLWKQIESSDSIFAAFGWLELVRLWLKPFTLKEWALLNNCYQHSPVNSQQRMLLDYALGQAYDKQKNYAKAAEHLQKANNSQLSLCTYRTEQMSAFFKQLREHYQHVDFSLDRKNSEKQTTVPIFIVGLPRTGSTLLEQMLCQHSDINSCGEQAYLSQYSVPFLEKMTQLPFPEFAATLADFDTSIVSKHYLEQISRGLSETFIINKLPANFQNIGLIYQLFPNARVVNITRESKDVSVSVFKNYFLENEPYFCDIAQFKHYSELYQQQMKYWQQLLPAKILTISYESLVMESPLVMQKVLSYIGVDWQDECLSNHRVQGTVNTLSAAQVRQPIHTNSIGLWQHYKALFNS